MQDHKKDDRFLFPVKKKRSIPWVKIMTGVIVVTIIVLIVSFLKSEPEPVSVEIELPKQNQI